MTPQTPVIDVLITRDGAGWRMYQAPGSWRTPFLLNVDARGDVYPLARPDVEDLDRFMFATDSPYSHRVTADGGLEIVARGRSAMTLMVWLRELMAAHTSLVADLR